MPALADLPSRPPQPSSTWELSMLRQAKILVSFALLSTPLTLVAQRGGGGGRTRGEQRADFGSVMKANAGGLALTNGEVEDMSPIKLIIDKRKDLKLNDDQVKSFKALETKMKEDVRDSFKALDSLRRVAAPPAREPNDEDRSRMMEARRTASMVVGTIRQKYDATLQQALTSLDENQKKSANELLEKQRQETDETLREKLGGRGRG
jgi:hypothetical protein